MEQKTVTPAEANKLRQEMLIRRRNKICGVMRQAVPKLMEVKPPSNPALARDYFATVGDIWGDALLAAMEIYDEEQKELNRRCSRVVGLI